MAEAHADPVNRTKSQLVAGQVHTFESFSRALISGALQSAMSAEGFEEGQPQVFQGTVTVTIFRDCFCIMQSYTDSTGRRHDEPWCRCHGDNGMLVN
jgi:hypothetical protein